MQTVVVRTFDNYFSANIILTRLQDSGINCYLRDEYSATVYPVLSNAIGGIKLVTAVHDAKKAHELLSQFHKEYMQNAVCPQCAKNDFIEIPRHAPKNILTSVLSWLFSGYAVSGENIFLCQNCGYESKTLPENTIGLN